MLSLARLIVVMSEDRPSAPRNIRADTVSSSAILLAWERPLYNADKVIAYSVHYMKAEGEWSISKQQLLLNGTFSPVERNCKCIQICHPWPLKEYQHCSSITLLETHWKV